MARRILRHCFTLLVALIAFTNANATQTFCIASGDATGLDNAMIAWQNGNNDTFVIELEQGTYPIVGALYEQTANSNTAELQLLGGYVPGQNCSTRTVFAPNTIITSAINKTGFLTITGVKPMTFEGITFQDVAAVGIQNGTNDTSLGLAVRYCIFNRMAGGVQLQTGSDMVVHDILVSNSYQPPNGLGALEIRSAGLGGASTFIFNNTIANNTGVGLGMAATDGAAIYTTNNVAWGNSVADIDGSADDQSPAPTVAYTDYGIRSGFLTLNTGNIRVDPLFVNPAATNFQLSVSPGLSPAINAGAPFMAGGYPATDLNGNPRIVGSYIDMGAYESSYDDRHQFYVTNANDSGAGSLRAAIQSANASPGPSHIAFDIPGGCGSLIPLQSALDDITYPLQIDGTTQPGWVANTSFGQFNATICIILVTSKAPYAFHATAATSQIDVHGIAFSGFSDAAIRIESGTGHVIAGDFFAGGGFLPQNHDAIRITTDAKGALIGGFDPSQTNLIVNSTEAGVYIDNTVGGTTVANNVIGIGADGFSPAGNFANVYIFNSPSNILDSNFIGNGGSAGVTISGPNASGNIVQQNNIGWDYAGSEPNAQAGVLIDFGANNNVVGDFFDMTGISNVIRNNNGPGIWVSPTGGSGNLLLANDLVGNGAPGFTNGLAIDLGGIGPDANSATVGTSGPNDMQNYPVLTGAFVLPNALLLEGNLTATANALYRLDFYYSNAAPQGYAGRGDAGLFNGVADITLSSSGNCFFAIQLSQLQVGAWFSATATSTQGNTSEISNAVPVISDVVFRDHFGSGPCL